MYAFKYRFETSQTIHSIAVATDRILTTSLIQRIERLHFGPTPTCRLVAINASEWTSSETLVLRRTFLKVAEVEAKPKPKPKPKKPKTRKRRWTSPSRLPVLRYARTYDDFIQQRLAFRLLDDIRKLNAAHVDKTQSHSSQQ